MDNPDVSWEDIAIMIEKAAENQQEPEPESVKIEKGLVLKWQEVDAKGKPKLDAKTKRPAKPIQVEVQVVYKDKGVCTIKNVVTGRVVVGPNKMPLRVKFADLLPN
jgi:hypothetical protein